MEIRPIAHIRSDFAEKFGIPRQSGLVESLEARVVFTPEFRNPDALRGIEGFSHLWLIWEFSRAKREGFSPTVRPPRPGGHPRLAGVAPRAPPRPHPLGLSCVRLLGLEETAGQGTALRVAGADLLDGTPIYDIKPYLPYADCRPEAEGGWTGGEADRLLTVNCPKALLARLPEGKRAAALGVLANDPRPHYQSDPERVYGMAFAGYELRFRVEGETLTVTDIRPSSGKESL